MEKQLEQLVIRLEQDLKLALKQAKPAMAAVTETSKRTMSEIDALAKESGLEKHPYEIMHHSLHSAFPLHKYAHIYAPHGRGQGNAALHERFALYESEVRPHQAVISDTREGIDNLYGELLSLVQLRKAFNGPDPAKVILLTARDGRLIKTELEFKPDGQTLKTSMTLYWYGRINYPAERYRKRSKCDVYIATHPSEMAQLTDIDQKASHELERQHHQ